MNDEVKVRDIFLFPLFPFIDFSIRFSNIRNEED